MLGKTTTIAATVGLTLTAWAAGGRAASAQAAPGKEAAIRDIPIPLASAARGESGYVSYTLLQNDARPGQVFTRRIWSSKAAMPKLRGVLGEIRSQTRMTPVL